MAFLMRPTTATRCAMGGTPTALGLGGGRIRKCTEIHLGAGLCEDSALSEQHIPDWRDGLSAEHIRACEEAARLAPVRIPQPAADSGAHKPEGDKGDGSEGVHRLSLRLGLGGKRGIQAGQRQLGDGVHCGAVLDRDLAVADPIRHGLLGQGPRPPVEGRQ